MTANVAVAVIVVMVWVVRVLGVATAGEAWLWGERGGARRATGRVCAYWYSGGGGLVESIGGYVEGRG